MDLALKLEMPQSPEEFQALCDEAEATAWGALWKTVHAASQDVASASSCCSGELRQFGSEVAVPSAAAHPTTSGSTTVDEYVVHQTACCAGALTSHPTSRPPHIPHLTPRISNTYPTDDQTPPRHTAS